MVCKYIALFDSKCNLFRKKIKWYGKKIQHLYFRKIGQQDHIFCLYICINN